MEQTAESQLSAQLSSQQVLAEAEERWAARVTLLEQQVRTLQAALTAAYDERTDDLSGAARSSTRGSESGGARARSAMSREPKPTARGIHAEEAGGPQAVDAARGSAYGRAVATQGAEAALAGRAQALEAHYVSRVAALEQQFGAMHADIRASQQGIAELARTVDASAQAALPPTTEAPHALTSLERDVHDLRSQIGRSAAESRKQAEVLASHLSALQEEHAQHRCGQQLLEQSHTRL
eukprot:825669-Prymnesium_polylepis.1